MSRSALIRTIVLLVIEAIGACAVVTFWLYPFFDAQRNKGVPALPPWMYVLTWLVICALATILIGINIRAYIHPEEESEA
jgi:membrane protein implicated in regulation of membrane protease activity